MRYTMKGNRFSALCILSVMIFTMGPGCSGAKPTKLVPLSKLANSIITASLSPDRSTLAVNGKKGIIVMRVDGTHRCLLVPSHESQCPLHLVWSPNSSMIAYYKPTRIAASNGREDWTETIEIVSLGTGRVMKIGVGVNFSWSLDSKKIMWMRGKKHQSQFVVSNTATGDILMTSPFNPPKDWSPSDQSFGPAISPTISTSPDDKKAIICRPEGRQSLIHTPMRLVLLSMRGSTVTAETKLPIVSNGIPLVEWCPDSSFALVSDRTSGGMDMHPNNNLCMVETDGSTRRISTPQGEIRFLAVTDAKPRNVVYMLYRGPGFNDELWSGQLR